MDFLAPAQSDDPSDPDAIIVKADEIDEAGADISAISPSITSSESDFNARIENRRAADAQTSSPKTLANAVPSPPRPLPRPILRRDGSAPAPPKQPPPLAPPKEEDKPTDSLSLSQLKKLVGQLPKIEPTAYAYEYAETRSFSEELQEWFVYSEEERLMLLRAKEDFEEHWGQALGRELSEAQEVPSWVGSTEVDREGFVIVCLKLLEHEDVGERVKGLECLSYIALGTWGDTVGLSLGKTNEAEKPDIGQLNLEDKDETEKDSPQTQLEWITKGAQLLSQAGAVQHVVTVLKKLWECEQSVSQL